MTTYPELAAAVIELHNNIAGSFAAPQQARATTEASPLDALKSIERMVDTMRQDALCRVATYGKSLAAAASFAEDVVNLYALLRLQDAIPIQMAHVVNETYLDALECINDRGRANNLDDSFVAYEDEVPF